jgi:hypothetical protein
VPVRPVLRRIWRSPRELISALELALVLVLLCWEQRGYTGANREIVACDWPDGGGVKTSKKLALEKQLIHMAISICGRSLPPSDLKKF